MNVLGLSSNNVLLQPYQDEWARLFEQEHERLRAAIGDFVLDIQHIGSTSIPGIPAKPILDIGVAVENFEEASRCIAPLEALGYSYRGENGIPRRHYFVKGTTDSRTHHLHINEIQSSDWQQQIAFRDALRQDAALAQEYAALKLRLAKQFPTDRVAYTEGKSSFISRIINRALPHLLPKTGDRLTVKVYKRDATLRRSWQATVESIGDGTIITFDPPGGMVTEYTKANWQTEQSIRACYWFDRPYNLLEVYRPNGELEEIYVHDASPPVLKNGEILYTDYELDVVKPAGEAARIVDQDEFAEAKLRYGYSEEFCNFCQQTAQELVPIVEHWQLHHPH